MHIYHDWKFAELALTKLRQHYNNSKVILVSDGDTTDYSDMARKYNCIYIRGERLFPIERGAEIVLRMLSLFMEYKSDWYFKIDPDTSVNSRIKNLNGEGVFGRLQIIQKTDEDTKTVSWPTKWWKPLDRFISIQGGCTGFSYRTAEELFKKNALWLPHCYDYRNWALSLLLLQRAEEKGLTSIDWTLGFACRLLGIPMWEHPEIYSVWRDVAADERYAITHPASWRV